MPIPTLTLHATITGSQSVTANDGAITVGTQSQNEAITFQAEEFAGGANPPHALQAIQFQASDLLNNLNIPAGGTEMNSLAETLDVAIPANFAHFWF